MNFYITGDTHLNMKKFDFNKYNKDDWMIILGDHMFLYYVEWDEEKQKYHMNESGKKLLNLVSKLPLNFFCINGTREAPSQMVEDLIEINFFGTPALAYPNISNLVFAIDGEVYNLHNRKALILGGATAPDRSIRTSAHKNDFTKSRYFPESEKFSNMAIDKGIKKDWLEADTLLCHTCPIDFRPYDFYENNTIPTYGTKTEENLRYLVSHLNVKDIWSGYYHINASKKFGDIHQHFLYNCIEKLAED